MSNIFGTLTSEPFNIYNNWIKPHIYVIGATAVGVYFLTPYVAPSLSSTFGLTVDASNALCAGAFAGVGVGILQMEKYNV